MKKTLSGILAAAMAVTAVTATSLSLNAAGDEIPATFDILTTETAAGSYQNIGNAYDKTSDLFKQIPNYDTLAIDFTLDADAISAIKETDWKANQIFQTVALINNDWENTKTNQLGISGGNYEPATVYTATIKTSRLVNNLKELDEGGLEGNAQLILQGGAVASTIKKIYLKDPVDPDAEKVEYKPLSATIDSLEITLADNAPYNYQGMEYFTVSGYSAATVADVTISKLTVKFKVLSAVSGGEDFDPAKISYQINLNDSKYTWNAVGSSTFDSTTNEVTVVADIENDIHNAGVFSDTTAQFIGFRLIAMASYDDANAPITLTIGEEEEDTSESSSEVSSESSSDVSSESSSDVSSESSSDVSSVSSSDVSSESSSDVSTESSSDVSSESSSDVSSDSSSDVSSESSSNVSSESSSDVSSETPDPGPGPEQPEKPELPEGYEEADTKTGSGTIAADTSDPTKANPYLATLLQNEYGFKDDYYIQVTVSPASASTTRALSAQADVTADWIVELKGYDMDWHGYQGVKGEPGELTVGAYISEILEKNGLDGVDQLQGINVEVANAPAGTKINYTAVTAVKEEGGDEPGTDPEVKVEKTFENSAVVNDTAWWSEFEIPLSDLIGEFNPDDVKSIAFSCANHDFQIGYNAIDEWKQHSVAAGETKVCTDIVLKTTPVPTDEDPDATKDYALKLCISAGDGVDYTISWVTTALVVDDGSDEPDQPTENVLWEGEKAQGTAWAWNPVEIEAAKFADAAEGDTIIINYTIDNADSYHQLKIMDGTADHNVLTSPAGVSEWGTVDVTEETFSFVLNAADVENIKANGMTLVGYDVTYKSVALKKAATEQPEEPEAEIIWDVETELGNWAAYAQIPNAKIANLKAGDTVTVYLKDVAADAQLTFKSTADGWPFIPGLKAIDPDYGCINLEGRTEYAYVMTADDIAALSGKDLVVAGKNATITKVTLTAKSGGNESGSGSETQGPAPAPSDPGGFSVPSTGGSTTTTPPATTTAAPTEPSNPEVTTENTATNTTSPLVTEDNGGAQPSETEAGAPADGNNSNTGNTGAGNTEDKNVSTGLAIAIVPAIAAAASVVIFKKKK